MIKNQKGVTLSALVITIIVLVILAGVTIGATTDLMSDSKVKTYSVGEEPNRRIIVDLK